MFKRRCLQVGLIVFAVLISLAFVLPRLEVWGLWWRYSIRPGQSLVGFLKDWASFAYWDFRCIVGDAVRLIL